MTIKIDVLKKGFGFTAALIIGDQKPIDVFPAGLMGEDLPTTCKLAAAMFKQLSLRFHVLSLSPESSIASEVSRVNNLSPKALKAEHYAKIERSENADPK